MILSQNKKRGDIILHIAKLKSNKRLCVPTITMHKRIRNKVVLNIEIETQEEFEAIQNWCFELGHSWSDIGQQLRKESWCYNFPVLFTVDSQNPHLYVSVINNGNMVSVTKVSPKIYKGQDTPSQREKFFYSCFGAYDNTIIEELLFKDYFEIEEV